MVVVGKVLHIVGERGLDTVRHWRRSNVARTRLILETARFKEPLTVLCTYLDRLLLVKSQMCRVWTWLPKISLWVNSRKLTHLVGVDKLPVYTRTKDHFISTWSWQITPQSPIVKWRSARQILLLRWTSSNDMQSLLVVLLKNHAAMETFIWYLHRIFPLKTAKIVAIHHMHRLERLASLVWWLKVFILPVHIQ